ncbi:MAG: hypothetical protein WBE81_20350, partial [Pseudolabrys sp.]
VPVYAMSGGTLIALAADEIVLGEFSVLGPIDPQIAGLPLPRAFCLRLNSAVSPQSAVHTFVHTKQSVVELRR